MPLHEARHDDDPRRDRDLELNPVFARPGQAGSVPRLRMPAASMDADTAYQLVHDELMLDGRSRLNLATFVTTWMEPQAARLMAETADRNLVDKDEYPQTAELERRCVHMLADLWHAPGTESGAAFSRSADSTGRADASGAAAVGCSTTGSSEAAMLAGMALLRRWRQRRRTAGAGSDRPNLVMGINVQVCWEKFCRYWEVEPRYALMDGDRRHLTPDAAVGLCDENTIGVVAVLGSTQDGSYEPVQDIAAALDALAARGGPDLPIHVDAASGGFVAPFLDPDLVWDFRLPRVASINASGHKYGLVYPGVGWALWRDQEALPEDLVFDVNYLGGSMSTFSLTFSRPGAQVVAQYYALLRLGRQGYARVQQTARDVAMYLSAAIADLGPFRLLTDGSELPVFAFTLTDHVDTYTVYDVSDALRRRGWQVPAYCLPANLQDQAVLRIVVRNGFSRDLADLLLEDLHREISHLELLAHPLPPRPDHDRFHH
jgi:glutamate decarboxylase